MCIFCNIIESGKFLSDRNSIISFRDINPQDNTHILFVTKTHISNLKEVNDVNIIRDIFEEILHWTKIWNISNFKIINNCGYDQIIDHLHFHVISKEILCAK